MVLLDAPSEWKPAGGFLNPSGKTYLDHLTFIGYIGRLKAISVAHSLDQGFLPNYGSAMDPYKFNEVPRATVRDDKGILELLVEAYDVQDEHYPNAVIEVYSTAPLRAKTILNAAFSSAEFSEPSPLILGVAIEDRVPSDLGDFDGPSGDWVPPTVH